MIHRHSNRQAFTLIELLIVITIIAALAALSLGGTMRVIGVQQERTTRTTIQAIANDFQKRWDNVIAKANEVAIENIPQAVVNLGGPATNSVEQNKRARVIYKILRLQQEFPMSFAEVDSPNILGPMPAYQAALAGLPRTSSPETQNAACLLMALERGGNGIQINIEDFGAGAVNVVVPATAPNGPSARGFVDAWGKPIMLCRFPSGLATSGVLKNPASTGRQARFSDPLDPDGLLQMPVWNTSGNGNATRVFSGLYRQSDRNPRYMEPVIWSAGPDKKFSLDIMNLGGGGPTDYDNIYSVLQKLGGS